ncbi:sensor histidine kinase [Polaribacter vadi]|uniref:tetratricopeptide repeat protein n=1 Tax=Polaribacter TaxID=52959 RepID=UPI001C0A4296|nr:MULTISPECIES: tetratricopeptide repeat protein [Polaribacter]MBU3010249.1 sensor histidine kinase [Polaribacter vadi]MDO6740055.1 sensor histidine kinase [Polaribacter sp. 1_MG-2023]
MKKIKTIILQLLLIYSSINLAQTTKIDSLKKSLKTTSEIDKKANTMMLLIDNYFNQNKDSSEYYIKEVVQLTKNKPSLEKTYINAILKYAQFYIVKGDYNKSEENYNKAWAKLKENYNYQLYSKYYGDFGVLHFYKGDFKGALNNFSKALELAEKENINEDQLRFLNNKALAMSYLGKAEASLDVHKKAISLAEKLNDSTALGKSFNNIGLIYEDMKEYEKALEFYLNALEIKKNGTSQIDVANSLYNVAGMYKEIGEQENDTTFYSKAENYYQKSLNIANTINYGKVILFNKTGIAQLATVRNQPKKAIEIYKSILPDAIKANDNQTLRITYLNLGVNYLKLKNLNIAENYLLQALPIIEKANNPSDNASVYKNLSSLYAEKKQFTKAYQYFKKQYDIEKDLTKNTLKEKISDFEIKYKTEKKEKEIIVQRKQLLAQELALKNRTLYLIILIFTVIILGIIFFGVYKKNQFKRKQLQKEINLKEALSKIKTQNRLQEQRLRISRDLHDNIGSQLTFIISSIDNLKYISKDASTKLKDKLTNISSFTGDTIHQLRDTIWAMNKSQISVEDLHTRVLSFIEKAKNAVDKTEFEIGFNIDKNSNFSSLTGMNVFRVIQEAINNSIKYADAKNIKISLSETNNYCTISIIDDGKGFDLNTVHLGNGLSNMEKRMSEIDGKVTIISKPKIGTEIKLTVKSLKSI